MPEFTYQDPFPLAQDKTKYRLLTRDHVTIARFEDQEVLKVEPEGLRLLAGEAMRDASFLLRSAHLEQVAAILEDPEASANDRGVALALLKNAEVAGEKAEIANRNETATVRIVPSATKTVDWKVTFAQ